MTVLEALYALTEWGLGDYTVWEIIDKFENKKDGQ
jgi:hypothetical protein